MSDWTRKDFVRRRVEVTDAALVGKTGQPARIEVALIVDGVQLVRLQAREPGMVTCIAPATTESIIIEVVEARAGEYRDAKDLPGGGRAGDPIEDWHADLLEVPQ
jgi:hypothetical protein